MLARCVLPSPRILRNPVYILSGGSYNPRKRDLNVYPHEY